MHYAHLIVKHWHFYFIKLMHNIHSLRTDIFCWPPKVFNILPSTKQPWWKIDIDIICCKIRFCSFKCYKKNSLEPGISNTSRNRVWWRLEIWLVRHLRTINHCFRCEFVPYSFFPFFADFLKGPLTMCDTIYRYSYVWFFRQWETTHYDFFFRCDMS